MKIVRQLVNSKGKVFKTASLNKTLKKGASFVGKINEALPKSLPVGEYTIKVKILDAKKKVLEQNSFQVNVEKLKKKYVTVSADQNGDDDIRFNLNAKVVDKEFSLPFKLKLKYSYINSTETKQTIKMVRELVDGNGKVLEIKTGKWNMKAGQKDDLSFTQDVKTGLVVGEYQIRVTAYDWKTKDVLAQNSASFMVATK